MGCKIKDFKAFEKEYQGHVDNCRYLSAKWTDRIKVINEETALYIILEPIEVLGKISQPETSSQCLSRRDAFKEYMINIEDQIRKINSDLKKIALAQKIVDDLDRLIKGEEKDDKVWELLVKVFSDIESSRGLSAYYRFFWNLVTILGYGPELHQCSRCHNKIDLIDLRLSPSDGGLVCKKCSSESVSFSIEKRALKMMLSYLNGDLVKINSDDKRMLWSMSQNYLFSIES